MDTPPKFEKKDETLATPESISMFCDESCHLLNDRQGIMVLGAVWCPTVDVRRVARSIRDLKQTHGLRLRHALPDGRVDHGFESKWTKVSRGKAPFYVELADLFFDEPCLQFRGLIVEEKAKLDHDGFNQTHDDWYYKMYFRLIHPVIRADRRYRIYLDIKDTRSAEKIRKLHDVLANANLDFDRSIVSDIQTVRSDGVELLQLADLLIGAIAYRKRGLTTNAGKNAVVQRIVKRSGKTLLRSTLLSEPKFNLFVWNPKDRS